MDELNVPFAAMVVAGVGLLVTFFNGHADRHLARRVTRLTALTAGRAIHTNR